MNRVFKHAKNKTNSERFLKNSWCYNKLYYIRLTCLHDPKELKGVQKIIDSSLCTTFNSEAKVFQSFHWLLGRPT